MTHVTLCRAAGNALGALYGLGLWVAMLGQQGRLRQADHTLQEALRERQVDPTASMRPEVRRCQL